MCLNMNLSRSRSLASCRTEQTTGGREWDSWLPKPTRCRSHSRSLSALITHRLLADTQELQQETPSSNDEVALASQLVAGECFSSPALVSLKVQSSASAWVTDQSHHWSQTLIPPELLGFVGSTFLVPLPTHLLSPGAGCRAGDVCW